MVPLGETRWSEHRLFLSYFLQPYVTLNYLKIKGLIKKNKLASSRDLSASPAAQIIPTQKGPNLNRRMSYLSPTSVIIVGRLYWLLNISNIISTYLYFYSNLDFSFKCTCQKFNYIVEKVFKFCFSHQTTNSMRVATKRVRLTILSPVPGPRLAYSSAPLNICSIH